MSGMVGANTRRVAAKLSSLQRTGADFVRTRWRFSWDEIAPDIINNGACLDELNALTRLQTAGIITIERKPTSHGREAYADEGDNLINTVGVFRPSTDDYASRSFNWAVWITGFDYGAFQHFCEEAGITEDDLLLRATVAFESISTPVVTVNRTTYTLPRMSESGKAFLIVEYCLNNRAGQPVGIDELQNQKGLATITNIKQSLRRSYFHPETGLLRCFIQASPTRIIVSANAPLSDEMIHELQAISTS